jgi:D-beta-D-heptose 7-phosphate kinase/D-beta-D-heptose 1-phosphate adenosyltransferase
MVKLAKIFQHLNPKRVLVLGDFMCDLYTRGKTNRVSPEAPVLVLHVQDQHRLAGGAGNVVFNLKSLGADVIPCGLIGDDFEGKELIDSFTKKQIKTEGIFTSPLVKTIVKNRLIADSQQLIRVDFESPYHMTEILEDTILEYVKKVLVSCDIVAFSDYQKGFLSPRILKEVIGWCKNLKIATIVDPKGDDFSKYQGATLIKPNLKEAYQAAKMPVGTPLERVAEKIIQQADIDALIITKSEQGMSYFDRMGNQKDFPVVVKEVVDVTGAGDTALAMITYGLSNRISIEESIELANIASSIAIEKLGCAHVTITDIAGRLLEFSTRHKIIDSDHFVALLPILMTFPYTLYVFDDIGSLNIKDIENFKEIFQNSLTHKKILYICDHSLKPLFMQMLAALPDIDFIVQDKELLEKLLFSQEPIAIKKISGSSVQDSYDKDAILLALSS